MDDVSISYVVLFFVCLFFSGVFSMCETAFLSLQRTRMKHLERTGVAEADRVTKIMEKPEKFLSGVLLGNNIVNAAAAALATAIAIDLLTGEGAAVLAGTIIVSTVLLVFGEITPKTIATRHSEKLALFYARSVQTFLWLLTPILAVLSWIASAVAKIVGGTPVWKNVVTITEDEVRTMITVGLEEGVIEESEAEMLHNIFEFGDDPVSEAMTPRPDIVWVEQGTTLREFLDIYAVAPHSRFPVFQEDRENVLGLLSAKDVLMAQAKKEVREDSPVDSLLRPVMFIPNSKRIGETFGEMQATDTRMAIVVDEFGSVDGVVTLEQLLEEIVGELGDELIATTKDFEAIDERTFEVDGGMHVDEANEQLGLDLPAGDYETVAGFVLAHLGHIPKRNEQMRYKDLRMVVTKMRHRRIESIRVFRETQAETGQSEPA
jgi:CBS domain containing-hemolysin-like protein